MRKFFVFLAALAVAGVCLHYREKGASVKDILIGFDGENQQTESPSAENMITFTDSEAGFRLKYPEGWKLDKRVRAGGLIRADISRGNSVGLQVRMIPGVKQSIENYARVFAADFKKDMQGHWGGEIVSLGAGVTGSSQPACRTFSFRHKRADGQKWFFKEILFKNRDTVIVFQCGARWNQRQAAEKVFDKIAETFEFVGRPSGI